MFPTNTTNLSFAGVVKWILLIASIRPFIGAWQGIVGRTVAGPNYTLIQGTKAVHEGLVNLGIGVLLAAGAAAVWFFWQRNED